MSRVRLALYKRPDVDLLHWVTHIAIVIVLSIRTLRWCPYSHAELEIDGMCHSASTRDEGTRAKRINLADGNWDVFDLPKADAVYALQRFRERKGRGYDWLGALRWALPFARQRQGRDYCFEIVADMLGMPEPHNVSPLDLRDCFKTTR